MPSTGIPAIEVPGDFDLKYFNIDRDKLTIIPYIRAAQKYNPDMTFWMSPWSPPAWMKINNHYAVQSSKHSDLDPGATTCCLVTATAPTMNR